MRRPVRSTERKQERKHGAEALAEKRPEKAGRVAVAHRSVLERVVADHLGVVGARGEEGEEQHRRVAGHGVARRDVSVGGAAGAPCGAPGFASSAKTDQKMHFAIFLHSRSL